MSGVVPYFLNLVGEAHADMGLAYMLNVSIPLAIPLALYSLVIIWGLRLVANCDHFLCLIELKLKSHSKVSYEHEVLAK